MYSWIACIRLDEDALQSVSAWDNWQKKTILYMKRSHLTTTIRSKRLSSRYTMLQSSECGLHYIVDLVYTTTSKHCKGDTMMKVLSRYCAFGCNI